MGYSPNPKTELALKLVGGWLKQKKDISFIRYLFFIAGSELFNLLPQKVVEADSTCRFHKD